ncbi:MAG: bile acid:sodium symporter family protein [Deltaproteobacteria bacterium]|nr:bile acid:sodium symporter family protein [Deltaproteobacteria bacterium]
MKIVKIFDWFTRLLPLWVVLCGIFAYFYPVVFIPFKSYMELAFALTMLGIGLVLNYEEFIPVFRKPQMVILGILAQFAIMPALGFFIAKLFNFPPNYTLALVLVGSVPGAMASNVICYLARVDVAFSIALTSVATFLAPFLTPAFTYLFVHAIVEVEFWPMFLSIIKMVIIPLIAGLILRRLFHNWISKFEIIFPSFSTVFIAFICGLVIALNQKTLIETGLILFCAVFLHNLLGLALGYGAGKLYRFDEKKCRTLCFQVGMQNAGLGAVLALKHFSTETALPSVLFATWCVITASILAEFWSRS